ncbi:MAG: SLC13 family permease [Paracoccus sp. (in: a-proteobacteria)]|nr:SLC13 family permease [Paracoccus sp. (in: a-proteobacteria)]
MTAEQMLVCLILVGTMALFLWGRLRHDVVALIALMASVTAGLVAPDAAFAGFGHPAVITVACVLILSQGLHNTGAVDWLARKILPRDAGRISSIAALMALGATLSGFMNNVGAMALLMPVAIQLSGRLDMSHGQVLMPLAFGTILGGMTTLIGTPPNIIVSGFRAQVGNGHFAMFDFAPVGLAVAVAGIAFVALLGWRLVPRRKPLSDGDFKTGAYLTEVRIPPKSRAAGLTLREFETEIDDGDAQIVGLVRNEVRMVAPHGGRRLREDDIVVLEADMATLAKALSDFGITLEEQEKGKPARENNVDEAGSTKADAKADGKLESDAGQAPVARQVNAADRDATGPDAAQDDGDRPARDESSRDEDIVLRELAVLPNATIVGLSATDIRLRTRYGLNLLAVSREGRKPRARLRSLKLRSGDLLLMQGPSEVMADFVNETGCVPLGERQLRIPDTRMALIAGAIMLGSVALATTGLLPAAAAFMLGALASMLLRTVPPRQVYSAIDWPVIVLLAALIPVAGAMQATGAADIIARFVVETVAQGNAIAALAVVLVTTMFLSDVMNNAATAAVLCPVAIGIATALGVNPDSFLMAVAIGASCAFLTPIGHQNNTLILGPGGFRFGDYWRLGLPLELVVLTVAIPMLLIVWPL